MIAVNSHLLLLILMVPMIVLSFSHGKLNIRTFLAHKFFSVLETTWLIAHLNHNLSNLKTLSHSNLLKTKVLHLPHPKKHILGIDASQIMLLMIAVISHLLLLILMVPIIALSFTHGKLKWLINLAKYMLSILETKVLIAHLNIDQFLFLIEKFKSITI